MKKEIIPQNETGKELDLFEEIMLASEEDAMLAYKNAKQKLLHPQTWKNITGKMAAGFEVADKNEEGDKSLAVGDYISIDIPGPGNVAGDGHDWVQVEKIDENVAKDADESIALKIKVSKNPEHPEEGVAHFFAEGASSTFIVMRKNLKVTASYHGRNEKPNLESHGLVDKIRNAVVAIGAIAVLSELQWKSFLKGLIEDKK